MSDAERAEARAEGALLSFIQRMSEEIRFRSPEYKDSFWTALEARMDSYILQGIRPEFD